MSVINQMLRDLDQRQGNQPRVQSSTPMISQPKQGWFPIAVFIALVIILSVSGYYFLRPEQLTPSAEVNLKPLNNEQNQVTLNQTLPNASAQSEQRVSEPVDELQPIEVPQQDSVTQDLNSGSSEIASSPAKKTTIEEALVNGIEASETNGESTTAKPDTVTQISDTTARVIKRDPNQSIRAKADAQLTALQSEFGASLSDSQYQQVLGIDPSYHQLRIEWLTQLAQVAPERFVVQVQQAMQDWPSVYQYRQMLARYKVVTEPREAYELLLSNMPTISKAPDYHGLIAYSAQQMGELPLAAKKYQLLLENFPERADWWLALGLLQEQIGSQIKALAAYQQSLRFPGLSSTTRAYAEQRVKAIQGY